MPCMDYETEEERQENDRRAKQNKQATAVLCGLVRAFGQEQILNAVDWEKVGMSQFEFQQWWIDHRSKDEERENTSELKMTRERMFDCMRLDPSKMTTEELFRQSGRTTRMVKAAVSRAREGVPVVIVMKDWKNADSIRKVLQGEANVAVMAYNPIAPNMKWSPLQAIGQYSDHEVFVDHDVVYFSHRKIFELQSKWDPKFEISGDMMTFLKE